MTNPENSSPTPKSWGEVLGPVYRSDDVRHLLVPDNPLIELQTSDDKSVCPEFQFDRDEDGLMRVNPDIGLAWQLLCALQVDQLGESKWTKAGMLTQKRSEFEDVSWAELLKDPDVSQEIKSGIFASIVVDADHASRWLGIELTDPRRNLST